MISVQEGPWAAGGSKQRLKAHGDSPACKGPWPERARDLLVGEGHISHAGKA